MIDIHSHILPGVDDGAQDMYDTLEMLRMSADCGVTKIAATCHCNIPGMFENYFGSWYAPAIREVREAAAEEHIPIEVMPGMEVYATEDLPKLIKEGQIMTLNQTHYMLIEFNFHEDAGFADYILKRVADLGVIPVAAHVERYRFVQDDPSIIYNWYRRGYAIQVNKGSLFGRFGEREEETAHRLIRHNLVSVVASDAHSPFRRTTYLGDAEEMLSEVYSPHLAQELLTINPGNICKDAPLARRHAIPFERYERYFDEDEWE